MENKLFRKASIDRISSPEQLHDYMRVTSPRLWMILAAILILAAGFLVFACTANMESTLDLTLNASYGTLSADMPLSQLELVKIRMPVRFAGKTGTVSGINQSSRLLLSIVFDGDKTLPDGIYDIEFADSEPVPAALDTRFTLFFADDGVYTLYDASASYVEAFSRERRVRVDGRLGTVTGARVVDVATISISPDDPDYVPEDGAYEAQIITESTTPISFLFN